jgi:hypothetical protein
MCPEDSKQYVFVRGQSMVVKNAGAFAMPTCGASIAVHFPGVVDVAIGGWLWAAGIGALTIVSFNATTQEITLRNDCPQLCGGQASPGTPISACTTWILGKPDCGSGQQGSGTTFPYLAVSFTAPAVGDCILITVTNVNGLSVNHTIGILTGTYRIDAILSATSIRICNDGAGLPAGTAVEATDGAGNLIVPIVLIDSNPCSNEAVLSGKLLVCDDDIQKPLAGTETGQIPVYDEDTGEVTFRTLGIPVLDCTTLTVCLTLDPALPEGTPYLVTVASTADFVAGDLVIILGTEFTVDVVLSPTQMRIIPSEPVIAIQNFPAGATLCSADCCTILDERVTAIEECLIDVQIADYEYAENSKDDAVILATVGTPYVRLDNTAGVTLHNDSPCKGRYWSMDLLTFSLFSISEGSQIEARMDISFDGGGSWTPLISNRMTNTGTGPMIANLNNSRTFTVITPVGFVPETRIIRTRVEVIVEGSGGDSSWLADTVIIDALGILG